MEKIDVILALRTELSLHLIFNPGRAVAQSMDLAVFDETSQEVVVNLIGSTTTRKGLHIKATLDENTYAPGIKVSEGELATLSIERDEFHGEWNYRLKPRDQHYCSSYYFSPPMGPTRTGQSLVLPVVTPS